MTPPKSTRTSGTADRAHAFGKELIAVHTWLRNELSRVTIELDDYIAGGAPPTQLQAHCLAFCQALTDHHRSEDRTAFPALSRQFPNSHRFWRASARTIGSSPTSSVGCDPCSL